MKAVHKAACAVAAAVLAATGCGAPRDGGAGRHASASRRLTAAEEVTVEQAEEILVRRCMAKAGFRYWERPVPSAAERKGRGYVLLDVAWARKHGYGGRLRAAAEHAARTHTNRTYVQSLSAAEARRYTTALDGDTTGATVTVRLPGGGSVAVARSSCVADAQGRLYSDFPAWFRARKTANSVSRLYVPDLVRDARFRGALRAWSACMRKAGHPYRSPQRIRAELAGLTRGLKPARAHATEVDLAVAEATCATRTSLGATARSLDRAYRAKRLGPYRRALADYRRMRLAALPRAQEITAS